MLAAVGPGGQEGFMQPEYIWGALSILLLLAEAVTLTSVGLVFGISAGVVFSLLIVFNWPDAISWQLMIFAAVGLALYLPVRRIQKMTTGRHTTGDIEAAIEDAPMGVVMDVEDVGNTGWVRLDRAFMGERQWQFTCDTPLQPDERIRIVAINGNRIKIVKGDER